MQKKFYKKNITILFIIYEVQIITNLLFALSPRILLYKYVLLPEFIMAFKIFLLFKLSSTAWMPAVEQRLSLKVGREFWKFFID